MQLKKFICVYTWYVNTPWCDVLINKVFSTFPTTRARNTTSNDVFPPGGIICWKNGWRKKKMAQYKWRWRSWCSQQTHTGSHNCSHVLTPKQLGLITWKILTLIPTTPDLKGLLLKKTLQLRANFSILVVTVIASSDCSVQCTQTAKTSRIYCWQRHCVHKCNSTEWILLYHLCCCRMFREYQKCW